MSIIVDKLALERRLAADDVFTRVQAERLADAIQAALPGNFVNILNAQATRSALKSNTPNKKTEVGTTFPGLTAFVEAVPLKRWIAWTGVALFVAFVTSLGGLMMVLTHFYH